MNFNLSSSILLGTSVIAATLSTIANPVEAFVITNTSGHWDNAQLSNGYLVGSDGYAAKPWNNVVFRENENDSQVRWGNSVNGQWEKWAFNLNDYYAGHKYKEGWYTNVHGQKVWGWYNYDYVSEYEEKSGLGFEGVSDLFVSADDTFQIGSLTHFNQTIWLDGYDATSADFSLTMDFGDAAIGTQTFDFTFSIEETDNHAAECMYQTDAGKGCSDRITWDWSIDESSRFFYEGEEYTLELVGFSEQVAASSIVNEFISQESGDNTAGIFARLVTVDNSKDIPEPTSLLGLAGLVAFAAKSRRKYQ